MESMQDIRIKYKGNVTAQSKALTSVILVPVAAPDIFPDLSSGECPDYNGIFVFLCVLRRLYTHVALRDRGRPQSNPGDAGHELEVETSQQFKVAEEALPLAELVFKEFEIKDRRFVGKVLCDTLVSVFGVTTSYSMPFVDIFNSPVMVPLWHPNIFRLFHYTLPEERWATTPELLVRHSADRRTMSEQSLVQYDGLGDLGAVIGDEFGEVMSRPDGVCDYILTFNEPAIVRVLFSPAPAADITLADLHTITIPALVIVDEGDLPYAKYQDRKYVLVCAVRLRGGKRGADFVRFWDSEHRPVPVTIDYEDVSSDEWVLGAPGHDYMLFYAKAPELDEGAGQ